MAMTIPNMAATFLLIVPLAWRGFEQLRDVRFVGGVLLSAERFAARHRPFLARWCLLSLAVVTFLPAQGGGVLGAGILGRRDLRARSQEDLC